MSNSTQKILAVCTLTAIILGYQNCARLPQYSSDAAMLSLSSTLTPQDIAATVLLKAKCSGCHSPGNPSSAGLENIDNLAYLSSRGYITPGNPNTSKIYMRIANQSMPPGSALPAAEQSQIYDWIAGMNGGSGGGGGGPTPTTLPGATTTTVPAMALTPTFASLNQNVFRAYCTGCHGPPPALAGGSYAMDTYANIRTQVTPGNANTSDLYLRMTNAGAAMPPQGLLPAAMANAVRDWINAGALNN